MTTTTTKLSFEGVVTLKTQEEADELVQAINTLIERGVFIFKELENGTSSDIENSLKAVIRLSRSFQEMTLDQAEEDHCKQVIEGMVQAEASVQRELMAYRAPPPGFDKEACKQMLAKCMQAFLARLAELCDMMEDNQNKRGVAIIKHTVLVLEYLCDPKGDNFNTMLEHFEEASRRVLRYTQNRENVSPRGGPLQTKLAALVPRLGTAVPAVTTASQKRRRSNAQEDFLEEKAAVLNLVQALKEAGDIFTSEGRIQTSFDFSYEKLDKALSNLAQAVQNRSGAEVASQAKVIVEAMKERKQSGTDGTAELIKATSQLLEATKAALASPNDQHAARLDKAVEGIRCQFLQGQPSGVARRSRNQTAHHSHHLAGLLAASADLTNCFAHLLACVQDQTSPK